MRTRRRIRPCVWERPEIITMTTVYRIIDKKDNPVIIHLSDENAALAVAKK